ncbi:MAG TPA: twin-arginine translocation signal domain-containing protein [Solirubrobacteraceae bacterium]
MTDETHPDESPITRRRFVAGTLVTGAAMAVPSAAAAEVNELSVL